jgi:hypothetical protein
MHYEKFPHPLGTACSQPIIPIVSPLTQHSFMDSQRGNQRSAESLYIIDK